MRNTMSKESLVCFFVCFYCDKLKKEAKDSPFLSLSVNSICKKGGFAFNFETSQNINTFLM